MSNTNKIYHNYVIGGNKDGQIDNLPNVLICILLQLD